jgi:hypothetical protein
MSAPNRNWAIGSRDAMPYALDYATLAIPEDALAPVRHDLYHSAGPGYHVFRGFLSPELTRHLQRFWVDLDLDRVHRPWQGAQYVVAGCPNFSYGLPKGSRGYFNFFWNHPADEASYAVSMQIQWLRNRVMGRTPFEEIFPLYGRSTSYRVVISRGGDDVLPHADWTGEYYIREPARLQGTLYLSTPGVDYDGDGFIFRTNQGERVAFGKDVAVAAGDLILWRYANEHGVVNVRAAADQVGFARIIYAPDEVFAAPPRERFDWRRALATGKSRLAQSEFGQRVLLPAYHLLKRRR